MDYWTADQTEIGMDLMEEKLAVERIVVHAIEKVNENLPDDAKITIPEAQGQKSASLELDSLTLINLILKIEEVFFDKTGRKLDLASDYVLSNAERHFASRCSLIQCIVATDNDQNC